MGQKTAWESTIVTDIRAMIDAAIEEFQDMGSRLASTDAIYTFLVFEYVIFEIQQVDSHDALRLDRRSAHGLYWGQAQDLLAPYSRAENFRISKWEYGKC
eukprot:IDg11209t1